MFEQIQWLKREGQLAECLVTPERNREFEIAIGKMISNGRSLVYIIDTLEREWSITPQEWIAIGFSLGYYNGRMSR